MDKTTIPLTKELHESLQDLAWRTGRPQAQTIREALAQYVVATERPWPASFGMVEESEFTSESVDQWLDENSKVE